jgi:D-sedoheptulose 7-phosphate isomerase
MDESNGYIREYLASLTETLSTVDLVDIEETIELLGKARMLGRKIFICGNGGSAATASHFACDLAKGTMKDGRKPFKVFPLTDNMPLITAWANDSDYSMIFAMQLEPLIEEKDIVIGISGSGNSVNILESC